MALLAETKRGRKAHARSHLTRIIATVGPASRAPVVLARLIRGGVDAFRLNFSHGSHAEHAEVLSDIRAVSERLGEWVPVMQDLQGPKLRIRNLPAGGIDLGTGEQFRLERDLDMGDVNRVGYLDEGWFDAVGKGHRVVLGDGNLVLRVLDKEDSTLVCRVQFGGLLRGRAGLNFPDSHLSIGSMTSKDWQDLSFGLEQGVDAIALSFVQGPADLIAVRGFIGHQAHRPLLIAKIETPAAVQNLDAILTESDGVMVARGDLGLTHPIEMLPVIQKRVIRCARERGKMVITATQMLESMTQSPQPTRAEVTDVANAVYDGTDGVMLSGETAVGNYPVRVVETMARILRESEPHTTFPTVPKVDESIDTAMAEAVRVLSRELKARCILIPVTNGSTVKRVSRLRCGTPIIAGTMDPHTARGLRFYYGSDPMVLATSGGMLQNLERVLSRARERGWVRDGDHAVATGGFPLDHPGVINFVRAVEVGGIL